MPQEGIEWLREEMVLNRPAAGLPASQRNFWRKPDCGETHDPRAWPSFIASHIEPFLEGGREVRVSCSVVVHA